jgi:hypothetical protein
MQLIQVIYKPTSVFLNLKQHPHWLAAFATISFFQAIITLSPELFRTTDPLMADSQVLFRYSSVAFVPLRNVLAWLFLAAIVYFLAVLLSKDSKQFSFRNIFAVVIYSHSVVLLSSILSLAIGMARWSIGLDPTLREAQLINLGTLTKIFQLPIIVAQYAEKINIFNLWLLGLLATGLSITTGLRMVHAGLLVIGAWLVGVGLYQLFRMTAFDLIRSIAG